MNARARSISTGWRSIASASKTVAAHSGSSPTSERTFSGNVVPSGIRITS